MLYCLHDVFSRQSVMLSCQNTDLSSIFYDFITQQSNIGTVQTKATRGDNKTHCTDKKVPV